MSSTQPLGKVSESEGQLTLRHVLIWLGLCTKFDHDISARQAHLLEILDLICLVALGDTLIEKSEVGAPNGMLYVHPWSRKATV